MESENNEINRKSIISFKDANIHESTIREEMPEILNVLLIDRTTSTTKRKKNIIWANENYIKYGRKIFAPTAQIKPELITGQMENIIMPRALKSKELQKRRTKNKGEVFTVPWLVEKQNNEIEKKYINDDLETYIKRKWLEITCGEGPYMVTRYNMATGEIIPLVKRVGFIDRKLSRVNNEVDNKSEWNRLVIEAYKASYGYEWSGDSLLLARENLLYSFRDYYFSKWFKEPPYEFFLTIAQIISYNVFQMDGLKNIIPLSDKHVKVTETQLSLFNEDNFQKRETIKTGKRVKIMNWEKNKLEYFDKGVK